MATTVTSQLLNAIKGRKWSAASKLFAPGVDFQAWTPVGHWVANDPATVGRILEAWFSPGAGSTIVESNESTGARGSAMLELEISWTIPPDDQPRVLREVYLMTIKNDRIVQARVYCAGLHTEFPEVDIDKQRRAKGLTAAPAKPAPRAAAVAAKA